MANARKRSRKIRRAVAIATGSGWTLAIFAVITALGVVFGDLTAAAMGVGLGVCAFFELRGAAGLRRYEASAAKLLAFNQLGLGVLIVTYSGWSLYSSLTDPALAAAAKTGDPDMDAMISGLTTTVSYAVYGVMAVVGVVAPGLTALYYASRGRVVRAFVAETPGWVLEALRAAV
jgi:hypothetical protein